MRKLLSCTALIGALFLGLWAVGDGLAGEKKIKVQGKLRVVVIDGQNNHDWRSTTPFMKKALEDSGRFLVEVSTNLSPKDKLGLPKGWKAVPFPPDLSKYDVVLSLT